MTPVQKRFIHWIVERENARLAKNLGVPYKGDPIIQHNRFCNVNREHDAVTVWIRQRVRPHLIHLTLVETIYRIYICRVFNEPQALNFLMPDTTHENMLKTMQVRRRQGLKLLRGAYLVVPHGKSEDVEVYYFRLAKQILKLNFDTCHWRLQDIANQLLTLPGMGEFMVNQVCADLRYQAPWGLNWGDWETFVLAGPGTRRGLARYLAGAKGAKRQPNGKVAKQSGPCEALLLRIREEILPMLPSGTALHLRDPNNLSNCFCEFDKYERAREGTASLRKYHPVTE